MTETTFAPRRFATDMTFYHHVMLTSKQILGHSINPHRWRHTRATEDAKYFTDQEMMVLNEWKRADVIRVYAHLSMRDVENKDLILHGLKQREEILKPLTEIRVCAKCKHENAPISLYCQKCGGILGGEQLQEVESLREKLAENSQRLAKLEALYTERYTLKKE